MMFILVMHYFKSMTTVAYRKIFKNRQIWNISYITSRNKNLDKKWLSLLFTIGTLSYSIVLFPNGTYIPYDFPMLVQVPYNTISLCWQWVTYDFPILVSYYFLMLNTVRFPYKNSVLYFYCFIIIASKHAVMVGSGYTDSDPDLPSLYTVQFSYLVLITILCSLCSKIGATVGF